MTPHPLDRPIWNALTSRQDAIALGGARARRYPADMAPFGATADESAASFAELAGLIGAADAVALFSPAPIEVPGGMTLRVRRMAEQMIVTSVAPPGDAAPPVPLTAADAPAMQALAQLTKPGPFSARTHELGRFFGVRAGDRLVAMAGERMHLDGFTEISAVCTDPAHRGHGYARALLDHVARAVLARGETPFLHVFSDNPSAIALYLRAGFTVRRQMHLTVLGRP